MESANFADLIGAERGGIRWGRPMIFFAALFLSDLMMLILYPLYLQLSETERYSIPWLPPPLSFLEEIVSGLALAFLLLAFFYLIKNKWLALVAVTVLYAVVAIIINFGQLAVTSLLAPGGSYPITDSLEISWYFLLSSALFVFFFIGGIILALYFIKRTWLAVLVGAVAGRLVYRICFFVFLSMTNDRFQFDPVHLVLSLIAGIIFASVFWLGLWITAEKTPLAEGEKPRLSKEFYAGTWAATGLIAIVSVLIAIVATIMELWEKDEISHAFFLLGFVLLLAFYGAVVFAVLIYKMWAAIQDGDARTTPGKALGFLFIPVFSIYWMFQALPGFAKDFNAFVDRHNYNVRHLPVGLFTAYCVLILCAFIPFVGFITDLAAFFVGIAIILKICDAVNALPKPVKTMPE